MKPVDMAKLSSPYIEDAQGYFVYSAKTYHNVSGIGGVLRSGGDMTITDAMHEFQLKEEDFIVSAEEKKKIFDECYAASTDVGTYVIEYVMSTLGQTDSPYILTRKFRII